MFKFSKAPLENSDIEDAITLAIEELKGHELHSDAYTAAVANLKTLAEVRKIEDEIEKPWRPSADTVITVAGSILGILSILTFEKTNIVTSKSLSFITKPKL